MLIFFLVLLLLVSAIMSGSETALFLMARDRQAMQLERHLRGENSSIIVMLQQPSRLLMTLLLGNLIVNSLFFAFSTTLVFDIEKNVSATAGLAASGAMLAAVILIGEIIPKTIASISPLLISRLTAGMMHLFFRIMTPITWSMEKFIEGNSRLFGIDLREESGVDGQILKHAVDLSGSHGNLPRFGAGILSNIIGLKQIRLKQICTPRVNVHSCPLSSSVGQVLRFAREKRHHMILLYKVENDDIEHFVEIADLLSKSEDSPEPVRPYARKVSFLPELARLDTVLREVVEESMKTIIVVDEYGHMAGLVTWNDLMEVLHGKAKLISVLAGQPMATRVFSGRQNLLEMPMELAQEDSDQVSLGGLIIHRLGRVPDVGEHVQLGDLQFVILEATDRSIERLLLKPGPVQA